jgi:hypothetical protein
VKKQGRKRSPVKSSPTRSLRSPKQATILHPLGSPLGTLLGEFTRRQVDSVGIPPELETVSRTFAQLRTERVEDDLRQPAAYFTIRDNGCEAHAELMLQRYGAQAHELPAAAREIVQDAIESTFRAGFYIAVMRYSDELKRVPEAMAVLNQNLEASRKGGEAQHKKAAPRHKDICKRFRELKKTIPKVTARYRRIAKDVGMNEGSIGRIIRSYNG